MFTRFFYSHLKACAFYFLFFYLQTMSFYSKEISINLISGSLKFLLNIDWTKKRGKIIFFLFISHTPGFYHNTTVSKRETGITNDKYHTEDVIEARSSRTSIFVSFTKNIISLCVCLFRACTTVFLFALQNSLNEQAYMLFFVVCLASLYFRLFKTLIGLTCSSKRA